jgi:uroporphyrinogen III methyltransferase/synthase
MSLSPLQTPGHVFFVGAGPGDPKLITLRGIECLRQADVVIYDDLVNAQILRHARGDAQLIGLGNDGKSRSIPQGEVAQRMVELARQGKTVLRLKGGDPAVFARFAEEGKTLAEHGIPFEVVPGITTALAAASYAGIPITHRDYAPAVALITAHEDPGQADPALDYQALARFPGTLAFYMGVANAEAWTAELIRAGKPPETPAAIVRRCSFPDQVCLRCRLDEVAQKLKPSAPISPDPRPAFEGHMTVEGHAQVAEKQPSSAPVPPPAVVIVGVVAGLDETLAWFDKRPLFGHCVLVTRPGDQAGPLADLLADLGAEVLIQPAIRISEPPDWRPVDEALERLPSYDWLVFSSSNGVASLLNRLLAGGSDLRRLGNVRLAAIGPGTADALAAFHLKADLIPAEFRAESLAATLAAQAPGKRFLLARASRGREVLAEQLRSAGAVVDQVVVYSSTDVDVADEQVAQRLAAGEIQWLTVTSSAIARSLAALFGEQLRKTRLASISPITSATLRELGYEPAVEARTYTIPGVVEAILQAVCVRSSPPAAQSFEVFRSGSS